MELTTSHRIFYSNENPIPVTEIAESLLALERVIKASPEVLERLFPGVKIDKVEVFIKKIESGSLLEDFIVKFFFGDQVAFDDFIKKLRKKTGMEKLQEDNKTLSVIILALILLGGAYGLSKIPSDPKNQTTIEANNNVIINLGAGMIEMSPDDFRAIIETSVKSKKNLAQDAIKVIMPAKKDQRASITFDDDPQTSLTAETIRAFPRYVPSDATDEIIRDYKNISVIIRATDLDSLKKGWAAVVPEVSDKRVPLQLDPNIDPNYLSSNPSVFGDVTVIFKTNGDSVEIPRKYFLRTITKLPIEDANP